jgi:hypothetical protein
LRSIKAEPVCRFVRQPIWPEPAGPDGRQSVAQAQRHHPQYLDTTYRDARNHLAHLMK